MQQSMKILVLAGYGPSLVNFRGPLIKAITSQGHSVHAAAPDLGDDQSTIARLRALNVVTHDVPFQRTGLNPLADLRAFISLIALMRKVKPDIVLSYAIKPVIWGMLAATLLQVPRRFALISGLGYAFTGSANGKRRIVQAIVRQLYRLAFARVHKVFFQNADDAALFRQLRLLPAKTPAVVVNGSGVDLDHYRVAPLPASPLRFLLIARLLGDKGIREYAQAAHKLRDRYPDIHFDLVGDGDLNPDSIPPAELQQWKKEGFFVWHGALDDVRPAISAAHVYVLPSYREGTPRTVLEAMSMGRAIITTNAPGCRETVSPGVNGFLVPVKDADALVSAMQQFIDVPELTAVMGRRSREIAEEKFDVHKVNHVMMREMGL